MKLNTQNRISIKGFEKAVKSNQPIKLELFIHDSLGYVNNLEVLFNKYGQKVGEDLQVKLTYDEEKSENEYSCFTANIQFDTTGYRTFIFKVCLNGRALFIKNNGRGEPILTVEDYPFFETFVYEKDFTTPDWARGGIMYQIYVDTFNSVNSPEYLSHRIVEWGTEPKWLPDEDGEYRNNRFFGGNLEGIIQKLPYLKLLGVNIIYLTPIFKSASSNRYDTVDYRKIDELVGDFSKLEELYKEAHKLDMYIVLDCVFNHCNPENELFKTKSHLFTGNCWWGYKDLVEFNQNSSEYQELIRELLRLYLKSSDGIRLDVADNLHTNTLRIIREEIKNIEQKLNKKIYILGEVWKNAVTGEHRSFLEGKELDSVMNYKFTDAIYRYIRWGDFSTFKENIFDNVLKLYPECSINLLMNPLSTHDIPRIPNILVNPLMLQEKYLDNVGEVFIWDYDKRSEWIKNGVYQTLEKRKWEYERSNLYIFETEQAFKLQCLAVVMQYTLPGIPSIFAGDELGVPGLKDPFNRTCMPWDNILANYYLKFYVEIGMLRKKYKDIFVSSSCELVFLDDKLCAYKRTANKQTMFCIFNRTDKFVYMEEKISGGDIVFSLNDSTNYILKPYDAVIMIEN